MTDHVVRIGGMALLVLLAVPGAAAWGQGASVTAQVSGIVSSVDGAPIADATVTITNDATAVATSVTSNAKGAFSAPVLPVGTYTVTIARTGFKAAILRNVTTRPTWPASLDVVLQIGNIAERVEVRDTSDLIQTQSSSVSLTLGSAQIRTLPFLTRAAIYALTTLPGVDATGGPRGALINGLPQQAVNITYDGVSVRDNFGANGIEFFGMVEPTFDAVEQATVTTVVPTAESAGDGAVSVRFITRSGATTPSGTAYGYVRHPSLNSIDYFRRLNGDPKNRVTLAQLGASQGGPLRAPVLTRGNQRAFYFLNYEEFQQRLMATTRERTLLSPEAQLGRFQYNATIGGVSSVRTVDLFQIAAAAGLTSTIDPTIRGVLGEIQSAIASTGTTSPSTDPNLLRYVFQTKGSVHNHFLTARVDENFSDRQRFTATYHWQQYNRVPDAQLGEDPVFPGLPIQGNYRSLRQKGSFSLRSLGGRAVNELSVGFMTNPATMTADIDPSSFDSQRGFELVFPLGASGVTAKNAQEYRHTPNWKIEDTLSWLRGRHSLTFGGSLTEIRQITETGRIVPTISFSVQPGLDPATALFAPNNFPGMSGAGFGSAAALYAFLTGRVSQITADAALDDAAGRYVYNGRIRHKFRMRQVAAFAQDQWRVSPRLSVNLGVAWATQLPVVPLISSYSQVGLADICGVSGIGQGVGGRRCNLFQPGVLTGQKPQLSPLSAGDQRYGTDLDNVAPNVGVAWQPSVEHGWLRTLLGNPATTTVRAGFGVAYNRNTMNGFQSVLAANPGRSTAATRNQNIGNLVWPGEAWPLLLQDSARLGPPATCAGAVTAACLPVSPLFPTPSTNANSISAYDPDIQIPRSRSYSIGIQRTLGRNTALEARYVRVRTVDSWVTENYNEFNVTENGFLDEFRLAQSNLYANVAAGRGDTFAYFGPGTGTSPLPILFGHFEGRSKNLAGEASLYSHPRWSSAQIASLLNRFNPSPNGFVTLSAQADLRNNGIAAGFPVNFWILNPDANSAVLTSNGGGNRYDALQIDVRRRLSNGLHATASYVAARVESSTAIGLHRPSSLEPDLQGVPRSFKIAGSYELPFGHGRRFGSNASSWLNAVAGHWTAGLTGRVQSGQRLRLNGVQLVGMTEDELQDAFKIRIDPATNTVYTLPQDIIDNTIRAFSTNTTGYAAGEPAGRYIAPASSGSCIEVFPGDCGEPRFTYVSGPVFSRFDVNVRKRFALAGDRSLDVQIDLFNVFNAINFVPVFQASASATINQVKSSYTDVGNTYDPGGRVGQFSLRLTW